MTPMITLRARRLLKSAIAALREGRLGEAEARLREYVQVQPTSWRAWRALGEAQQSLGKVQESEQSFQRCLALNPRSVEATEGLALIYGERDGDWGRCLPMLQECLKKTTQAGVPEFTQVDLAWTHYLRNDPAQAEKHLEHALGVYVDADGMEEHAGFAATEYRIGILHHALHRDADRARQHLRQAIRLSPESIYARRAREAMEQLEG